MRELRFYQHRRLAGLLLRGSFRGLKILEHSAQKERAAPSAGQRARRSSRKRTGSATALLKFSNHLRYHAAALGQSCHHAPPCPPRAIWKRGCCAPCPRSCLKAQYALACCGENPERFREHTHPDMPKLQVRILHCGRHACASWEGSPTSLLSKLEWKGFCQARSILGANSRCTAAATAVQKCV
eukprot:276233-Rhodomonas_salina.3